MDSKNIFIASKQYSKNVVWLQSNSDSEWIYIGNDIAKANFLLSNYFNNEQPLYFAGNRHNSSEVSMATIKEHLKTSLEKNDFLIWDFDFQKVVEFNKIGVYRIGTRNS